MMFVITYLVIGLLITLAMASYITYGIMIIKKSGEQKHINKINAIADELFDNGIILTVVCDVLIWPVLVMLLIAKHLKNLFKRTNKGL